MQERKVVALQSFFLDARIAGGSFCTKLNGVAKVSEVG